MGFSSVSGRDTDTDRLRIPDELVAFLDRSVADGLIMSRAVERAMRRQAALADAVTLATQGTRDGLDHLVAPTSAHMSFED